MSWAAIPKNWARFCQGAPALVDEPQVGLVHQGGGLEGVARVLPLQIALGLAVQLLVNDGDELVQRGRVAAAPRLEQTGHALIGGCHSCRLAGRNVLGKVGA